MLFYGKYQLLTSFQDFGFAEPITRALKEENYLTPTPIQAQTIPLALAGHDVVGIAQTGTGKTAAFTLPILHRILQNRIKPQPKACRVLVLSPTRELSGQILDSFRTYGRHIRLTSALAIGGVPMGRQVRSAMQGVEVMVATPGRLLDLVGVKSYAQRTARELPEGQRKLVDIALALALKPKLLLMDEPTSGVASSEKLAIMDILTRALAEEKVTSVFVEHDMDMVERYANRVAVWNVGKIQKVGTPAEVLADPKVREQVIGI